MKVWAACTVAALAMGLLVCGCGGGGDEGTANPFVGTITGSWQGSGLSGTFTVTVSEDGTVTGTFSGDVSGTITGNVDEGGVLIATADGAAGPASWDGQLVIVGGVVQGEGTWQVTGADENGTWVSPALAWGK